MSHPHEHVTSTDKPQLITLIGMWLIFAPPAMFITLYVGFSLINTLRAGIWMTVSDAWINALSLSMVVVTVLLYTAILWRVTSNYLRNRARGGTACTACGYDLRGNPQATHCPECGHVTDDHSPSPLGRGPG